METQKRVLLKRLSPSFPKLKITTTSACKVQFRDNIDLMKRRNRKKSFDMIKVRRTKAEESAEVYIVLRGIFIK